MTDAQSFIDSVCVDFVTCDHAMREDYAFAVEMLTGYPSKHLLDVDDPTGFRTAQRLLSPRLTSGLRAKVYAMAGRRETPSCPLLVVLGWGAPAACGRWHHTGKAITPVIGGVPSGHRASYSARWANQTARVEVGSLWVLREWHLMRVQ